MPAWRTTQVLYALVVIIDWLQQFVPETTNLSILAIYGIVIFVVIAFFREWGTPDVVALAAMGAILLLGVLPLMDVVEDGEILSRGLLSVFSNGAPITIACMFVLSAGLERTGAINAMGRFFSRIAGKSELRVLLVMMTMVAVLSAFVNNTPIVVVFLPIVLAHARAVNLRASKLLIPLSFASILGGTCTLTGSSTNLIIDSEAQRLGLEAFGMFELTKLGIIYAVVGFLYLLLIGRKLLPNRSLLSELIDSDVTREVLTQFQVEPGSELVGKTLVGTLLKKYPKCQVLEVRRRGRSLPTSLDELIIHEKDRLLITVHGEALKELREGGGIRFQGQEELNLTQLETRELKLLEGIIGPRSNMVGKTLQEVGFRRNYGINVLAIHRQGVNLNKDFNSVKLAFGDTLFMEGPPEAFSRLQKQKDFVSISDSPEIKVHSKKVWIGVGIALAFVLGASFKILGIPALAILAALAMILSRCITAQQAYEAVQWNIVFLIFGMLSLGLAMDQTGAAQQMVSGLMAIFGEFSPFVILAVVYLLSSTLTELISNNAVAALLTPIIVGIADKMEYAGELGVDPRPFIVAMMFGCSASFATPIGYQTNTYVYGAGGYKFTDFPKVGIPLNLLLWVVASILIPIFWPFR
ncbi:MAG: SLC13 family permease [Verrucomicrobiales bacterium]|nr:SLC13 family permease [Verrucomicrobiales bacterium]